MPLTVVSSGLLNEDSGPVTPQGLQDVIDVDNELTESNIIVGNSNDLAWNDFLFFEINAQEFRLQTNNQIAIESTGSTVTVSSGPGQTASFKNGDGTGIEMAAGPLQLNVVGLAVVALDTIAMYNNVNGSWQLNYDGSCSFANNDFSVSTSGEVKQGTVVSALVKADSLGVLVPAVPGTDYATDNIYIADGTITGGDRTLDGDDNALNFNNLLRFVVNANDNVDLNALNTINIIATDEINLETTSGSGINIISFQSVVIESNGLSIFIHSKTSDINIESEQAFSVLAEDQISINSSSDNIGITANLNLSLASQTGYIGFEAANNIFCSLTVVPSPEPSALVQLDTTTQGFLPPRMTTTQVNAIASPADGLIVYDTTLGQLAYYSAGGASWVYL